jgi:hypothetical protein
MLRVLFKHFPAGICKFPLDPPSGLRKSISTTQKSMARNPAETNPHKNNKRSQPASPFIIYFPKLLFYKHTAPLTSDPFMRIL